MGIHSPCWHGRPAGQEEASSFFEGLPLGIPGHRERSVYDNGHYSLSREDLGVKKCEGRSVEKAHFRAGAQPPSRPCLRQELGH